METVLKKVLHPIAAEPVHNLLCSALNKIKIISADSKRLLARLKLATDKKKLASIIVINISQLR